MYQRVLEDDLEFPMDIDPDAANFISGVCNSQKKQLSALEESEQKGKSNILPCLFFVFFCLLENSYWSENQSIAWEAKAPHT